MPRKRKINWNQRLKNIKTEFGDDAIKLIYSNKFNEDFLNRFGQIYCREGFICDTDYIYDFENRSWLNFPGPFYTVDTDNCGTGQAEAPENVLNDEEGREHIFRQPKTIEELSNVFLASYIDPFQNYGIDGNENWTLELITEWWRKKDKLINFLETPNIVSENDGQNKLYINYLNENAEIDLRKYAYYIENSHYPLNNEDLPEIK